MKSMVDAVCNNGEERHEFGTEVPQLMSIIVNNVYPSKEVFFRELVSNASDALEKMMMKRSEFEAKGYKIEPTCSYRIRVILNEEDNTITIQDNGIGMTKADMRSLLGTIASSGTKRFRAAAAEADGKNVDDLIGQFGIGFYSGFLVAERIDVVSKNPLDEGHVWSSTGEGGYTIAPHPVESHGTSVILHVRELERAYLKKDKAKEVLERTLKFVKYPVYLVTREEAKPAAAKEKELDGETAIEEVKEEEEVSKEPKLVEVQVSSQTEVWSKPVEQIPEEELKAFYKSISNDYDDYAAVQSWRFDSVIDLNLVLFIPKRAPMSLFEGQPKESKNIKIFNSNVFVTDVLPLDVVPDWSHFVHGVASSSKFAINISRETLQGNSTMNLLKRSLPRCIAEMIERLARDEEAYAKFYEQFSASVKLAVRSLSGDDQKRFAKFLRYPTNQDPSKLVSLDEYLAMLPEDAKQILVVTGLNKEDVKNSLFLEAFKDKPVLLMSDSVDEVMLKGFRSYNDIPFQMITAEGAAAEDVDPEEYKALKEFVKTSLESSLEKVLLSTRFADDIPATIVTTKYAESGAMESILRSSMGVASNPLYKMMLNSKKIMELNMNSPVIQLLKEEQEKENAGDAKKLVDLLFDASMLACGFNVEDKLKFYKNICNLIVKAYQK